MFHPTSATSFPCVRVAHPPADKIRFVPIGSSSLQSFAQYIFGLRYRGPIQTFSRCYRVHHEGAASDVKRTISSVSAPNTRFDFQRLAACQSRTPFLNYSIDVVWMDRFGPTPTTHIL